MPEALAFTAHSGGTCMHRSLWRRLPAPVRSLVLWGLWRLHLHRLAIVRTGTMLILRCLAWRQLRRHHLRHRMHGWLPRHHLLHWRRQACQLLPRWSLRCHLRLHHGLHLRLWWRLRVHHRLHARRSNSVAIATCRWNERNMYHMSKLPIYGCADIRCVMSETLLRIVLTHWMCVVRQGSKALRVALDGALRQLQLSGTPLVVLSQGLHSGTQHASAHGRWARQDWPHHTSELCPVLLQLHLHQRCKDVTGSRCR